MRVNQLLQTIGHEILLEEEADESTFVCLECIGDSWLKRRPAKRAVPRPCAGCGTEVSEALMSKDIAKWIKPHLPNHFTIDDGLYPGYGMTLTEVVGLGIRCESPTVCSAVAEKLIDPDVDEEQFYFHGHEYCQAFSRFESEEQERSWVEDEWSRIAAELMHGRRFFNPNASGFFEAVMAEAMHAGSEESPDTSPVVKVIPERASFYRARIASTHAQIEEFQKDPPGKLGAPPKDRAANNRMSPAGVPLLYVADDPQTGLAEVRPSIGDKVVVGEFISRRPLEVFDFTALTDLRHKELSWFEPLYRERTDRRLLLEYLHDLIARPVRANDTDYVMTQALAEYIRYYRKQRFDGISFRSVQREGGVNFVIFDRSTPEALQTPGWLPKFDLDVSKEPLMIFEIERVQYHSTIPAK